MWFHLSGGINESFPLWVCARDMVCMGVDSGGDGTYMVVITESLPSLLVYYREPMLAFYIFSCLVRQKSFSQPQILHSSTLLKRVCHQWSGTTAAKSQVTVLCTRHDCKMSLWFVTVIRVLLAHCKQCEVWGSGRWPCLPEEEAHG